MSDHAADMIEFLAYSGVRIAEARGAQWEDVGADFITITGGEAGTKNHEPRNVPILPDMADLLSRMRARSSTSEVHEER